MERAEKWLHQLLPIIFLLFGLLALSIGFKNIIISISSYNWAQTNAKIVDSRIVQNSNIGSKNSTKKYSPSITYSYHLDGINYTSDRISFGMDSGFRLFKSSKSNAKDWVNRYPLNSTHFIFYNPNNHSESTILKGLKPSSLILPLIGFGFILVGITVLRKS